MSKKKDAGMKPESTEAAQTPTAEQARQILLQEQTAKQEACMQEVDAVLRKHECSLDVQMLVTTRGVTPSVRIIPAPPRA